MWQQLCNYETSNLVTGDGTLDRFEGELFTPLASTVRLRLPAATETYLKLAPPRGELLDTSVDIGNGIVVDAVWAHDGQVVVDEIDQEDLMANELRLLVRAAAILEWGHAMFDDFVGIRVVNVLRPYRCWFISELEPGVDDGTVTHFDMGAPDAMPDWMTL